jgi:hypothetical protein
MRAIRSWRFLTSAASAIVLLHLPLKHFVKDGESKGDRLIILIQSESCPIRPRATGGACCPTDFFAEVSCGERRVTDRPR